MRVSDWYTIIVCEHCLHRLTSYEQMYNEGTCPHCGYSCDSTVTDYKKVTIRELNPNPWWKIFNRLPSTYEGVNQFSRDWLNR